VEVQFPSIPEYKSAELEWGLENTLCQEEIQAMKADFIF
jgi:hypothetical protein